MSIAIQEIQKFVIRIDEEVRRIELGSYFPRFICVRLIPFLPFPRYMGIGIPLFTLDGRTRYWYAFNVTSAKVFVQIFEIWTMWV